jgi:hypothetical protein
MGSNYFGNMRRLLIYITLLAANVSYGQIYSDATMDKKSGSNTFSDFARGDKLYTINYAAGIPLGSLSNFISGKLFDGLNFETRTFRSETSSLGLSIGFNSFQQKLSRANYSTTNGAYSSVQTRFMYTVPVLITGTYHFPVANKHLKPYAGLGLGGHVINYDKWDGTYPDNKFSVRFGGRPFAGVLVPLGDTFGLNASVRYNYAIYKYNEVTNLGYPEIAIGIYFIDY